ncbi:uncharacterized protein PAC_16532 [Phialocephala subalpina]|uniref:F-box domain-containing protein n=1 Tax=Phialocephala subalpina TaxID=576137 RepID=A0A1L7XNJ3_9HELO|nr:uncharacterized protein PAC_16532 [Phialocephala subalpina]
MVSNSHSQQRPSSHPDNTPPFQFLKLPAEIRNMIYSLLVVSSNLIYITTPTRKPRKKLNALDPAPEENKFRNRYILFANKQTYQEARVLLYSLNTFAVGNGWWGSTIHPNLHGLKLFTQRVPNDCISRIKKAVLFLLSEPIYNPANATQKEYFMDPTAAKSITEVCTILRTRFKGLDHFEIQSAEGPGSSSHVLFARPWVFDIRAPQNLISNSIEKVLRVLSIKEVEFLRGPDLTEAEWVRFRSFIFNENTLRDFEVKDG